MIGPTPNTVETSTLVPKITSLAREFCDKSELLHEESEAISGKVREILELLPDQFSHRRMLTVRCLKPAKQEVEAQCDGESEKYRAEVGALQKQICREINLDLYSEYIQQMIEQIKTHCQTNEPPKRWGLGSICSWEGKKFYNFWHRLIEGGGDECFVKMILPQLPESWQENYEALNRSPHNWNELYKAGEYAKIADALMGMEKKTDITKRQWGIGSIHTWSGENGERWGDMFMDSWRRNVEKPGDEMFKMKILPHFSEEAQEKYEMINYCPHKWRELYEAGDFKGIAEILMSLDKKRDPAQYKWGPGSIFNWSSWGNSFYDFWRSNVDSESYEVFENSILVHFPEEWQNNYEHRAENPHKWRELILAGNYEEIATRLKTLKVISNPATNRWGLGSFASWTGPNGECWGMAFYTLWRQHLEPSGDEVFRKTVLQYFPDEEKRNYKLQGYKIKFNQSDEMTRDVAARTDDINELYVLADIWGNEDAFNKLVDLITIRVISETHVQIGDAEVETIKECLHRYVDVHDDLVNYCRSRILYDCHYNNTSPRISEIPSDLPEDKRLELAVDPSTGFGDLVYALEDLSFDPEQVTILGQEISEGRDLQWLMREHESPEIRDLSFTIHNFLRENSSRAYL